MTNLSKSVGYISFKTTRYIFILSLVLLSSVSRAAESVPFLEDDFDSGSWQSFWSGNTNGTISNEMSRNGTHSSKWVYPGVGPSQDGWAEARFDLGQQYDELTITFDWYIPSNYFHRDATGPDNNKFFRLWSSNYNDKEKIGASLLPHSNGNSSIGEDYRRFAGWGFSTQVTRTSNFVSAGDRGKWMSVRIYVKVARSSSPAVFRLFKNGELFHEAANILNDHTPGLQGYRYGYLLGWANSGYTEETTFYIDNVRFYGGGLNPALPPLVQVSQ